MSALLTILPTHISSPSRSTPAAPEPKITGVLTGTATSLDVNLNVLGNLFPPILLLIFTIFSMASWFYWNEPVPSSPPDVADPEKGTFDEFNVEQESEKSIARTVTVNCATGVFSALTVVILKLVSGDTFSTAFVVTALALISIGLICSIAYAVYGRGSLTATVMTAFFHEVLDVSEAQF